MAHEFTDEQRQALEFPGNVIVSAGAGSGKTRVLVEKYFRLLVDDHPEWPVDSVVAITFTRKAAAELKSRIVIRVGEELEVEPKGTPRRARLETLRCEVGAAAIGTIHTFCGRLLREFAFDAHLDPDYAIVEGAQEGALRLKAARETIAEATAANGTVLYQDLLRLLNIFSASKLTELLSGMLAGRTSYLAPATTYVAHSVEELFAQLSSFHTEYVTALRQDIGSEWRKLLGDLSARALPGKAKAIADAALADWPLDHVAQWSDCSVILDSVIGGLFTQKGQCRKSEFNKAGFEEFDALREEFEKLLKKHCSARLADLTDVDRDDLQLSRQLARLFLRAVEVYDSLRGGDGDAAEVQLVDYSDLEILAAKLIQTSVEIRQQIQQRYPYLIIDEFQDTSEAQWEILKPVVTTEDGRLRPNSLFVVGDRKQGVYGFRDANVALFSRVHQLVSDSNTEWNGTRGGVTMAANFRTSAVPLEFINDVFARLLTEASSAYSVEFEPLKVMNTKSEGCVEFLLACADKDPGGTDDAGEQKLSADERKAVEAGLVAAHIKELVDVRQASPGQIALLFRKRSAFRDYELALKELGIPCVTQQGINLFQQQELGDVMAALNSVVYPHQDLVFVHYLRSPYIGFTDDLLLKIGRSPGRSFWDKANTVLSKKQFRLENVWHPLNEMELDRLQFALNCLHQARLLVGAVSPGEVLKFIIAQLGIIDAVGADNRGLQAAANLDKLMQMANGAQALSFEEFLDYIRSEEQSINGTPEAVDPGTVDAVRIMTIHAAKGLEFPVVYLPDLNSGTSGRGNDVYGDGSHWMTVLPPKSTASERSFLMDYFKLIGRKQQEAEERRVFYVAMTRCKERLILCANAASKPRGETFYNWITQEFDQGKAVGKLKTEQDYEALYKSADSMTGALDERAAGKASRQQRIEASLGSAGLFHADRPVDGIEVAPCSAAGMLMELLPDFLPDVLANPVDAALSRAEPELAILLPDMALESWRQQLAEIGDWIKAEFPDRSAVKFRTKVRICADGQVTVFEPHISITSRVGWIAMNEEERIQFEQFRELYQSLTREVEGAPVAEVWFFAEKSMPVMP